jgi:hypothetical protein
MKINEEIFAIIDPSTNEVLGNGDCPAIYSSRPNSTELGFVKKLCSCEDAKVVRVRLVKVE